MIGKALIKRQHPVDTVCLHNCQVRRKAAARSRFGCDAPTRYIGTLESMKITTALDVGQNFFDISRGVVTAERSVEGAHSTFGRDCTPVLQVVFAFFAFLRFAILLRLGGAGSLGCRRRGRKRRRGKSAQHAPRGFQLVLRQLVHQSMKPISCGHTHVCTPMLRGAGQARPHVQANLSLGARQSNPM